jgi:LCP family protein required for cell wall assembly
VQNGPTRGEADEPGRSGPRRYGPGPSRPPRQTGVPSPLPPLRAGPPPARPQLPLPPLPSDGRLRGRDRRELTERLADDSGAGRRPPLPPRRVPAGRPPGPSRPVVRPAGPAAPAARARVLLRSLVALASVLVLAVTGTAWRTIDTLTSQLATTGALDLGPSMSGARGAPADGATDILLVGTDSRSDAQGNPLSPDELALLRAGDVATTNTDTIILVRVPNDGGSASAVSIPRDSSVDVPGQGRMKINGAYGTAKATRADELVRQGTSPADAEAPSTEAGRTALVDTVQELTGVTVDHYAEIGLLGFVLLTDAVDGVPVCLAAATSDPFSGADFPAGVQTLSGADALSFVRQRKNLPRGDLDRITRQQVFMASLAKKVLSAGTLTSPGALSQLSAAVQRSVVIDSGWDVVGFATQLAGLAGGAVTFQTIPVVNADATSPDGSSIVEVDPEAVRAFTSGLLGAPWGSPAAVAAGTDRSVTTVDVSNASGTSGLAARVAETLSAAGFGSGSVGNASPSSTSSVLAPSPRDAGAVAVAAQLGGLPVRQDDGVQRGTVRVVLGSDYSGPGSTGSAAAPAPAAPAAPAGPPAAPVAATGGPTCIG